MDMPDRIAELLLRVAAVRVGLVLVIALDVPERARLRPGGVRARRQRQQRGEDQSASKSRSTKWRIPSFR